jgi:hypothetical protein
LSAEGKMIILVIKVVLRGLKQIVGGLEKVLHGEPINV